MKIDRVCIEPIATPARFASGGIGIVVRAVQSVRGVVSVDDDTAQSFVIVVAVVARCVAPRAARATSRPSVRLKPMIYFFRFSFVRAHREATCDVGECEFVIFFATVERLLCVAIASHVDARRDRSHDARTRGEEDADVAVSPRNRYAHRPFRVNEDDDR